MPTRENRLPMMRQAIDRDHPDRISIKPLAAAALKGRVADPLRASFDVVGLLRAYRGESANLNGSTEAAWHSRLGVGRFELFVDPAVYPLIAGVAQGDQIIARDRGNATYEVLRIDRGQRSRTVLYLGATS